MNILAIGSHPDDIEYGCGGTLLKFKEEGHKINMLIMTKGDVGGTPKTRSKEQILSARILDAKIYWGGLKDTRIVVDRKTIGIIEKTIALVKPYIVFTHYHNDTHQDHRHISQATMVATRHMRNVLFYEVPTTMEFLPTVFVKIDKLLDRKLKLLHSHESQVYAMKIPGLNILENVKSCAIFRGFQDRVRFAEGFMPLRLSLKL
ncbi:MAG: PIG-L deacetylase family protein [Candidatus Firestonebacteria bacterium]